MAGREFAIGEGSLGAYDNQRGDYNPEALDRPIERHAYQGFRETEPERASDSRNGKNKRQKQPARTEHKDDANSTKAETGHGCNEQAQPETVAELKVS